MKCQICQKITISVCQRCLNVFYCSIEHQKLDWERHKAYCLNNEIDKSSSISVENYINKQERLNLPNVKSIKCN